MDLKTILSKPLKEQAKIFGLVKHVLANPVGEVALRGWVYRARGSTNMFFVVIKDGSGIIQCTVSKDSVPEPVWKSLEPLYPESSVVALTGVAKKDERAPGGAEIQVKDLQVLFRGEPFPIGKDQSIELLLDKRHLWVRSQKMADVFKFKHELMKACREYLDSLGFIEVQPPLFTVSACEGGAEVFEVKYFDRTAYLSQSGQLYSEAMISGNPLVYVFAPSFRSDPSRTPRHLTEFWQMEPEMAWYDFDMNLELQENLVQYFCHKLGKEQAELLKRFGRDPQDLLNIKAPFDRMTYETALDVLQKKGVKIKWGDGIGLDEEKILVQENKQPIFLINLPKEIRAFYMKINPQDPRTVLDGDLLAPEGIGEIIGGSERVSDYSELIERMKIAGLNPKDYEWFTDLRKYGTVPHSGFGMGSERICRWLLKLDSVKDAIPFPRTMNRLAP
ncbi:MAG: asparagine--tRNA ligase [Candidatus Diapherotrites archaeon]|nr:asparagine--tRNA ligase [Candidatus Diapherotrites archaeon]